MLREPMRIFVDQVQTPQLHAAAFSCSFAKPLAQLASIPTLMQALCGEFSLGFERPDDLQATVRRMLRVGGYAPNGRGKPSSEYLQRAVRENALDSINVAVDACNAISLQSGLPISVIDLDLSSGPWRLQVVDEPLEYIFNRAGQTIALAGLLCLHDTTGPCANPVKDAQRTKTSETTTRTLSVIWGPHSLADYTQQVSQVYQQVLAQHGAQCEVVTVNVTDSTS